MTTKPEPGSIATNAPDSSSYDAIKQGGSPERTLSPAASRALAEAEARRQAGKDEALRAEKEIGGRGGADPSRFGDWEINGRAIDF